jgi:hypothetical protein
MQNFKKKMKQNLTFNESLGNCYKTFYHGNLLPFHDVVVILCNKVTFDKETFLLIEVISQSNLSAFMLGH